MVAMAISAQCRLLGAGCALPLPSPRFSSPSLSSSASSSFSPSLCAKSRPLVMRIRASSSSPPVEVPPVEAPDEAALDESSTPSASSADAEESPSEPESASIERLDIPTTPAQTASLVSRTSQSMTPEGAAGLAQVNHYLILQIPYGCSSAQITRAYKERVEEVKKQEKELGEEAASERLLMLKASYDVLDSVQERRVYDWVLQRYENRSMDTYIWPYETDTTRYTSDETPPVMRSFDEEGNNRVALFLLGWVLVSIVFSLTMKTWIPYPHYRNLF